VCVVIVYCVCVPVTSGLTFVWAFTTRRIRNASVWDNPNSMATWHTHTHTHTHTHKHMHMHKHTTHVQQHNTRQELGIPNTHTHAHTYIHTYIHTRAHTHTHVYYLWPIAQVVRHEDLQHYQNHIWATVVWWCCRMETMLMVVELPFLM